MNREEQIKNKSEEFLPDNILDDEYPYRAEFAFGFQTGAKWADENPKHYSFKEAMDACMGSYEEGGRQLLYVANQTAERTKKEVISKACKWLEKELFTDPAEPNPYYATDVKSKTYDTKEDFIFEFRKAMEL